MILEQLELRKVRPSDYLKDRFFNHTGDWIEGLNSICSLATAHHLHAEGTNPAAVKKIADQLMNLSLDVFGDAEMIEYQLIDEWSREAILEIVTSPEARNSVILTELFETIRSHLNNWKILLHL